MSIQELNTKIELLEKGLPIDWLLRAERSSSMEEIIYLSTFYDKWKNYDQKVIAAVLEDHKASNGKILKDFDQEKLYSRKRSTAEKYDPPENSRFTKKLYALIQEESVIWDKDGNPQHGLHRPMRQAWCNVSLKLGGWGTINHIKQIKAIYKRKRDEYNYFLRGESDFFEYEKELDFLRETIERHTPNRTGDDEIEIEEYIKQTNCAFDFNEELDNSASTTSSILRKVQAMLNSVNGDVAAEKFANYLTTCCTEIVALREASAIKGLSDKEWCKT